MRILHINKYLYAKGGAEVYMLRTARQQAQAGHTVAVLGAGQPDALVGDVGVDAFSVPDVDYHSVPARQKPGTAARVLWNPEMARRVSAAAASFRPDVVHLHNYAHQLTSAILAPLRRSGARIVYTAHDYKLICPAYVASVDGADCFACSHKLTAKPVKVSCHHGSRPWSAVVIAEAAVTRRAQALPDVVVAPSAFMQQRVTDSWLGPDVSVTLVRNPVDSTQLRWKGDGDYLLYVGRLSREKGVDLLIEAAADLGTSLAVAGDGPERPRLESIARERGARVDFLGHVGSAQLDSLRTSCLAQIIPSTWPENAPLAALEAGAMGTPIVASRRGGLPELADQGAASVCIDEVTASGLSGALATLATLTPEPERFSEMHGWRTHLDALDRVYLGGA